MTKEERIVLRDKLFKELLNRSGIIYLKSRNVYQFHSAKYLLKVLNNDSILKNDYNSYIQEFRSETEGKYCIIHSDDKSNHKCPICNNECDFYLGHPIRYKKTCGNRVCIEKLANSKESREKCKRTNLEKYGVEYSLQSKEVRDKSKQINLIKRGVEYPTQSKEVRDKIKQTCLEKYGVENPFQAEECKNKAKQTLETKYNIQIAKQMHMTNLDVWNDDDKFKEFIVSKYNEKGMFLVLNDVNSYFNVWPETIKKKIEMLNLVDYFYIQDSNLEILFRDFLNDNHIKHHRHDHNIIYPKEIDFLLDDYKIGFEINDIHSHHNLDYSHHNSKDKKYHYDKVMRAKEKGIHLIHIWEWELRNDNEWSKLSNWILNLLNNSKISIGARKCTIKEVLRKEEKEFLNKYHLQGYKKSEICLGLYYDDELLQLMSFSKPRYNKNYQYELLRLCTKYGYSIIGGANKLFKNFIARYNPISIISYCNLDKFNGKVYNDIGFKLDVVREPQIIWCNKNMKHFSQSSLNWIGADKLLGANYGKGTDNEEIVKQYGYVPIYNCGLAVYSCRNKK